MAGFSTTPTEMRMEEPEKLKLVILTEVHDNVPPFKAEPLRP